MTLHSFPRNGHFGDGGVPVADGPMITRCWGSATLGRPS